MLYVFSFDATCIPHHSRLRLITKISKCESFDYAHPRLLCRSFHVVCRPPPLSFLHLICMNGSSEMSELLLY